MIVVAVEAGRAEPVLQGEIAAVADAEPALLGGIDEEQSAERPERLAAKRGLRLLIEDDDAAPGVGQFGGSDQSRKTRANDDGVCVHAVLPHLDWSGC